MPINLIDYSKAEYGESGISLGKLCDEHWEMPIQIELLETWLVEKGASLPKGEYLADLGFSPRTGALGGGAVLSTKAMEVMVSIGMELYLSEYPEIDG